MKKSAMLFILLLAIGAVLTSCDQQEALDQILQNPEMKAYMMTKMMQDETVKQEITNQILADSAWSGMIVTEYAKQMSNREMMMTRLLEYEGMGLIMLEKMAEDDVLKEKMKEIGRRR